MKYYCDECGKEVEACSHWFVGDPADAWLYSTKVEDGPQYALCLATGAVVVLAGLALVIAKKVSGR